MIRSAETAGVVLCLLVAACATPHPTAPETSELRYRLASDPQDDEARAALARRVAKNAPAVALEHFDILHRRGRVDERDRALARSLWYSRARARLERGDPEAAHDLELSGRRQRGLVLAALRLRIAHLARLGTARNPGSLEPLIRRHRKLDAAHPLSAWTSEPKHTDARTAAALGQWLWGVGARWEARRWLDAYDASAGPQRISAADEIRAAAEGWWRGEQGGAVVSWPTHASAVVEGLLRSNRDSAVAEREIGRYVHAVPLPTDRALEATAGYLGLGDPKRAHGWALAAVAASPSDAEARFQLGRATMAIGDRPAAEIHWTHAAAMSGDPGATYVRAAGVALAAGEPLFALAMARRGEPLAGGSDRASIRTIVEDAERALGRR